MVLLSVGLLAWFLAIRREGVVGGWRRYIFLVAGLWFFLSHQPASAVRDP